MLFNSVQFVIFFIAVVSAYFLLPHRFRWMLVLGASFYFYMVFIPWYVLILIFLIVVDFFLGKKIESSQGKSRKFWLLFSIFSNVGMLFVFKYFNFFHENISNLAQYLGFQMPIGALSLALPVGLSFHTFQSLSYVVEVYRGKFPAEKHLGIYGLYVMFFPQLVAGPIERPEHMLPQFRQKQIFQRERVISGMQRMILGFFKKIVIADHLAIFVNTVYGSPSEYSGISLALATVFFAFQIYCDFSGYCDIAIGAARILGYELTENFRAPYLASSISEFWRRWHISLSLWFRDYVYIPLGGSRGSELKTIRNLLLTFILSGLWHGANWTFVIWGGLNGLYLILARWKDHFFPSIQKPNFFSSLIGSLVTFVLICFSWIFFRAETVAEGWYILTHMFSGWTIGIQTFFSFEFLSKNVFLGQTDTQFFVAIFGVLFVLVYEYFVLKKTWAVKIFSNRFAQAVFSVFLVLLTLSLWEGKGGQFIYFQF